MNARLRVCLGALLALLAGCGSLDVDGDGWTVAAGDCDDLDWRVFPGADERCDSTDDDCDGEIDEDAVDAATWYVDGDGDGYGWAEQAQWSCEQPVDASTAWVADDGDCDDGDAEVHPGALERCDGLDDDCDGAADEEPQDGAAWYQDLDGDGWGNPDACVVACEQPDDAVALELASDCDDEDAAVHPEAEERCNGLDDDCDGGVDEDPADPPSWYLDEDGDGYGSGQGVQQACEQPDGHSAQGGDCDEGDPAINPGAEEVCNTLDDDCDGSIDEDGAPIPTWYADADGDGYGDPATAVVMCEDRSDMVLNGEDCDDGDSSIHPGASDPCNGVDDDCDGADEGCEDCGNGVDDNADGLVDCEDALCFEDSRCYESSCDDGLDDDGDGLVDCEDDECWGAACHPAGVRSRVGRIGNGYRFRERQVRSAGRASASAHSGSSSEQLRALALLVSGTVQVLPAEVSSWDSATARTTCSWQVGYARVSTSRWTSWDSLGTRRGLGGGVDVNRSSFSVASGCRLGSDSWFLPQRLWFEALTAHASYGPIIGTTGSWGSPGPRWYFSGTGWDRNTRVTSTYTRSPGGAWSNLYDYHRDQWSYPDSSGETWLALP
jgi:hypothetical protein